MVTFAVAVSCAPRARVTNTAPLPAGKIAELWEAPTDIATRDLLHGAGGARVVPDAGATYTWVATDTNGFSDGYEVRGPDGRTWDVKLGVEAQSEVFASRVLWAIGYHQPATYYVASWQLNSRPRDTHQGSRFRLESEHAEVSGEWSWADNDFIGTQPYNGLITANILMNSWDWKTSNNKVYRLTDGGAPVQHYVVRDLGASFGKTSPSRLLWILPIPTRGFGQGSRNNVGDFESQGFIRRVTESDVEFEFHSIYGSVVDLVRPSDVRWTAELLSRLSDAQWDDAFRAAHYAPDIRTRFIRKIKAKIAEGLAVS